MEGTSERARCLFCFSGMGIFVVVFVDMELLRRYPTFLIQEIILSVTIKAIGSKLGNRKRRKKLSTYHKFGTKDAY